jgi:hypothetical protein
MFSGEMHVHTQNPDLKILIQPSPCKALLDFLNTNAHPALHKGNIVYFLVKTENTPVGLLPEGRGAHDHSHGSSAVRGRMTQSSASLVL